MKLNEALELVKFHYSNYKHNKRPRVKVLDFEYPGRKGQKTYNQRKDLLGWNLNYFKNPKQAQKSVDEIDSFARLVAANNREKYERVRLFFPEAYKYLRRYMRKHIKGIKRKDGVFWRKTNYTDLIKFNKENF